MLSATGKKINENKHQNWRAGLWIVPIPECDGLDVQASDFKADGSSLDQTVVLYVLIRSFNLTARHCCYAQA